MGTQGPGRKRIPNRDRLAAEEDAMSQIAREAEARLAAKRAARAEAREIRMKELERQQKEEDSERYSRLSRRHTSISDDEERMSVGSRGSYRPSDYGGLLGSSSRASSRASSARASPVVEERTDREFIDKGSRTASTLSAATLASLGGASSRRGSCDTSFSVETEASIREMKDSLAEAEEKYRRAMVSNAQLHNDKTTLMFQVENLREELSDMEELLWEARRRGEDSSKELERERQAHSVLKVQFKEMEESLRRSNELLTEVSDLRLKSGSYRQEVSDLQETLQWKEKKIAALERHRETSDIVRIERDRLRAEVVRLRDSLKDHGVLVSPDTSTNGDAEQAEDECASRLAEDSSQSGRESMLGKASERQPAEDNRTPQNDPKDNNMISGSDQARPSRERRNPAERRRNRQPRSKGADPTKNLPFKGDGNRANKKQPSRDGRGEPDHRPEQAFRDTTTAGNPGSVGVMDLNNLGRMRESTRKTVSVLDQSSGKVLRSRLVPPRPAKEMILDNRLVVLGLSPSGKLKSLSEETINQDVPSTLESKASSSETDVEQKDLCSLDVGPQSPDEDAPGFSEVGPRESMVETERLSPERSANRTEAKLETQAAATSSPESLGRPEQCQKQSPGDPLLGATQTPTACPEHPQRTSPFVPEDTWTSLENTVQDLLQGLEDTPGFVVEISRIFSEILICLHQWISDLENTLRNGPGNESCQNEGGGHALIRPVVGSRPSMKTWLHLASLAREPAERPGCVGGDSASHRVGSASERMENQSGSSNRASSTPHHHTASTDRGTWSRHRHLQMDAESGASPAGCCFHPPASPVNNSSADFVFVDSYFAEPQSRSELSLGKTSDSQSHLQLPASESKELRGNRVAAHSAAGQSSSVRRFMEVTAEEIRALAVPELALLGLQEGRRLEGSSVGSVEELSVEDMDSCEEADEEEEEIRAPPPQQQDRSRTEAEVHAVVPPLGSAEPEPDHEEPSLDSRKHDNTDCKIS
ncbi:uncharacterized protein lrrfip1b isoform X2 [Fundulus heteroclitus]|uniref:uncharacterized protein lrrfip1b isoform X2 n=1 Tax=Fundulus heteroclitus TaxID=8078 RepID=UPI00165CECBB|nr:uncharacterized protein lrrfip1b isoform X2 [Fundulus heteroclitus]